MILRSFQAVVLSIAIGITTIAAAEPAPKKFVSVDWSIPQLSNHPVQGGGTGFLLSRAERIVVTAFHVIPNVIHSLKPGMLKVNGVSATMKCFWKEADVALLVLDADIPDAPELRLELNPSVGMKYESGMTSDKLMQIGMPHDAQERVMTLGGSLRSRGVVMAVSEAMENLPDGNKKPTGAWYLLTDTAAKQGFSGGPAITNGKVIGIQQSMTHIGSYGALSSSVNIVKLRADPTCK